MIAKMWSKFHQGVRWPRSVFKSIVIIVPELFVTPYWNWIPGYSWLDKLSDDLGRGRLKCKILRYDHLLPEERDLFENKPLRDGSASGDTCDILLGKDLDYWAWRLSQYICKECPEDKVCPNSWPLSC